MFGARLQHRVRSTMAPEGQEQLWMSLFGSELLGSWSPHLYNTVLMFLTAPHFLSLESRLPIAYEEQS